MNCCAGWCDGQESRSRGLVDQMAGVALCTDYFVMLRMDRAVAWQLTTASFVLFGGISMLLALKAFGDPAFSAWLAPGPGTPLLGDAGNMLAFEAGSDGVHSKILGVQANLVEGCILGLASLSMIACWSSAPAAQLLTAVVAPIGGVYLLVSCVYFQLTGEPAMVPPMLVLGTPPVVASIGRIRSCHPESRALMPAYIMFLAGLAAAAIGTALWISYRVPRFHDEVSTLRRVRHYFLEVNGMRWSAGSRYPDGFVPEPRPFAQRVLDALYVPWNA